MLYKEWHGKSALTFPKDLHTRLFGKQRCLQATQIGPQSSPWFSPVPTHLSKIKSRESGCQMAAVEGESATALKQRLPRGAGRRGAGDADGAAVSQCSSPSPKRETHAQPRRGGPLSRTSEELEAAPSCRQPTRGTPLGRRSLPPARRIAYPRLPCLPTVGYFLRTLFLRIATNTKPRLCREATAPSPALTPAWGLLMTQEGKASALNVGDPSSIPGSRRSPGEGNGNSLQYSFLENPMDRGAW